MIPDVPASSYRLRGNGSSAPAHQLRCPGCSCRQCVALKNGGWPQPDWWCSSVICALACFIKWSREARRTCCRFQQIRSRTLRQPVGRHGSRALLARFGIRSGLPSGLGGSGRRLRGWLHAASTVCRRLFRPGGFQQSTRLWQTLSTSLSLFRTR